MPLDFMKRGLRRMPTGCASCFTRSCGRAGATRSSTFCDVERAIQQEIRNRNYLARYELRAAEAVRSREMEILKQLGAKYRTVAPPAAEENAERVAPAITPPQAECTTRLPCKPVCSNRDDVSSSRRSPRRCLARAWVSFLEVTPTTAFAWSSDNQEDGVVVMRTYIWIGLAVVLGGLVLWGWWYQRRRAWSTRKQDEPCDVT